MCDHREGTNFSLCIWLMLRRVCGCLITGRELISVDACGFLLRGGLCLCDHSEGTNLSGCMWILLRCVCDCVITGRELFQWVYVAYIEEKVCVCLMTGRELISVDVCGLY